MTAVLRCWMSWWCAQVLSTLQAALSSYKGNVALATSSDSCYSSQAFFVCQPSAARQDWRSRWISTPVRVTIRRVFWSRASLKGLTFIQRRPNLALILMLLPPDTLGEGIMFFWRSICCVCSFVYPDRSCYHDISWMAWTISMKLTVNNR